MRGNDLITGFSLALRCGGVDGKQAALLITFHSAGSVAEAMGLRKNI